MLEPTMSMDWEDLLTLPRGQHALKHIRYCKSLLEARNQKSLEDMVLC